MRCHRPGHQDVRVRRAGADRRGGGRGLRRLLLGHLGGDRFDRRRRADREVAAEGGHHVQQAGQRVPGLGRRLAGLPDLAGGHDPVGRGPVDHRAQRPVVGESGDPRDEREDRILLALDRLTDQRAGLVVVGLHQSPGWVVRPGRAAALAVGPVGEDDLPGAVVAPPGVPALGLLLGAAQGQPLGDRLAQLRAGGLAVPADRGLAGPLGHEGALGQHRTLEAADPVDGDAGGLGDLLGGGTGSYPRLDVPGAEVALDLDLDLAEARPVTTDGGPEPLVDGEGVLRAVGSLEHQPCAVVADGHNPQFGHAYLPGGACRRHLRRCSRTECGLPTRDWPQPC